MGVAKAPAVDWPPQLTHVSSAKAGAPAPLDQGQLPHCVPFAISTCVADLLNKKFDLVVEREQIVSKLVDANPSCWQGSSLSEWKSGALGRQGVWLTSGQSRFHVDFTLESLNFVELWMHISRFHGIASAVCTVQHGTDSRSSKKHAVAAAYIWPDVRCVLGVNSWGTSEPNYQITESNFFECYALDPFIKEWHSSLPEPQTTRFFKSIAKTPSRADIPKLQVPEAVLLSRLQQLSTQESPGHVVIDALHHICELVQDKNSLCRLVCDFEGMEKLTDLLYPASELAGLAAQTISWVCFRGGGAAQRCVNGFTIQQLALLASNGDKSSKCRALEAFGMICLHIDQHVTEIGAHIEKLISFMQDAIHLRDRASIKCAATAIGRVAYHQGAPKSRLFQAGVHHNLLKLFEDPALPKSLQDVVWQSANTIMNDLDYSTWIYPPEKSFNPGTICYVRGAAGNDKIRTEFEVKKDGVTWRCNPAVKLSNLEMCEEDDSVQEVQEVLSSRHSLPDPAWSKKRLRRGQASEDLGCFLDENVELASALEVKLVNHGLPDPTSCRKRQQPRHASGGGSKKPKLQMNQDSSRKEKAAQARPLAELDTNRRSGTQGFQKINKTWKSGALHS